MDQVVVAYSIMPQSACHVVLEVFKHYGDAELFVQRQTNPADWILSVKNVKVGS